MNEIYWGYLREWIDKGEMENFHKKACWHSKSNLLPLIIVQKCGMIECRQYLKFNFIIENGYKKCQI